MHKTRLFLTLVVLLVFMAVVHLVATYLKLYWSLPWIDRVPHFTGGALAALSVLWFAYISGYIHVKHRSEIVIFSLAIVSALVVGLLWEIFEVYFGITLVSSRGYFLNNGQDIVMDIIGGAFGYAYFSYRGYSKV